MKTARVLLIVFCLSIPLPLLATEVLIVHSGAPSFAEAFAGGLRSAAGEHGVELAIEDIRLSSDYGVELAALWRRQYAQADLVVTLDEASRRFVSHWSKRIFTQAGLVALVYQPVPEPRAGWSYLRVAPDLPVSLSLLKRLRPGVRHVVLVFDPAELGAEQIAAWRKSLQPFAPEVQVSFLANDDMAMLEGELKRLGPAAAVVYAANSCGRGDDRSSFNKMMQGLNVPVLGLWNTYLGQGLVGGNLLSASDYGRFVGERLGRLKADTGGTYRPRILAELVFDRRMLKQLHIRRQRLPEDARLIGQPPIWRVAPEFFGLLAAIWLLTLVWGLWLKMGQRRCLGDLGRLGFEFDYIKAEQLKQQELLDELQNLLLENDQELLAVADSQGRFVMTNPAFSRIFSGETGCECLVDLSVGEGSQMQDEILAGGRWAGLVEAAGRRFSAELRMLPTVSGLAAYQVLRMRPEDGVD